MSQAAFERRVSARYPHSDAICVYRAAGLLTQSTLPRICAELTLAIHSDARACLINLSRAVLLLADHELAECLASIESAHSRALSGAWVVQEADAVNFRWAALALAQRGIARRVFTDYAKAYAWAEVEALLPRW